MGLYFLNFFFLFLSPTTWFGGSWEETRKERKMMWMTFDDSSILFASMIMRESKDFFRVYEWQQLLSSKYIHLRWKPARTGTNFKWNTFLCFLICFIFFCFVSCGRHFRQKSFVFLNLSKPICSRTFFRFKREMKEKVSKNI